VAGDLHGLANSDGPEVNSAPINAAPIGGEPDHEPDKLHAEDFSIGSPEIGTPALSQGERTDAQIPEAISRVVTRGFGQERTRPFVHPVGLPRGEAPQGPPPPSISADVVEHTEATDSVDAEVLRPVRTRAEAVAHELSTQPANIEAMASELASACDEQRERLRGKNDQTPEEDGLLEFFNWAAGRLRELAEAVRQCSANAGSADDRILRGAAAKIVDELQVGFFEALTKHRAHLWEYGGLAMGGWFLSSLVGVSPAEALEFLRGVFKHKP
jgi:hypothetical protein